MSFESFYRAAAGIGDAYAKGLDEFRQREALTKLGQQLQGSDYSGAASTAFNAGDAQTGLGLLKLGQTARQQQLEQQASQQFISGLGLGGAAPTAPQQIAPRAEGSDTSRTLPTFAQGTDIGRYASAIGGIESGGRYDIVGPTHKRYGRALGKYQVMESNLPSWSREAIGREVSPDEFLSTPAIQDAIFAKKFGQSVEKYGNPQDAASVWFTGRPVAQGRNARDSLGTTGQKYVNMFTAGLDRGAAPAPSLPATAMRMPSGGGASVQIASTDPRADLPAEGAQPAAFEIPGDGAGNGAVSVPTASPVAGTTAGAIAQSPLAQRIPFLLRAAATPNLPDGQRQLAQTLLKQALDESKISDAQKDYLLARSQGFGGTYLEYQRELKRPYQEKNFTDVVSPEDRVAAGIDPSYRGPVQRGPNGELRLPGKASTEVVMPAAEKAQDVKIGSQYGEVFNASQADGRSAAGQLNTLRLMEKLIENPNFYSGAGSSTFISAKRAAAALGVPGAQEAVAPNELFAKLASQSVLDKLGGNLGAGVSNADVTFITQTTANAANTPEGNRQIIQFGKALAQRQIDVAKLARKYASSHQGRLDSGFDEELAAWAQANPLFPEATAAQRTQQAPPSQPAPQAAPLDVGGSTILDGVTIRRVR